jgi:hypothetical protein
LQYFKGLDLEFHHFTISPFSVHAAIPSPPSEINTHTMSSGTHYCCRT